MVINPYFSDTQYMQVSLFYREVFIYTVKQLMKYQVKITLQANSS